MYQASTLFCTYLAHHEIKSIISWFILFIICTAADEKENTDVHWLVWQCVAAAAYAFMQATYMILHVWRNIVTPAWCPR